MGKLFNQLINSKQIISQTVLRFPSCHCMSFYHKQLPRWAEFLGVNEKHRLSRYRMMGSLYSTPVWFPWDLGSIIETFWVSASCQWRTFLELLPWGLVSWNEKNAERGVWWIPHTQSTRLAVINICPDASAQTGLASPGRRCLSTGPISGFPAPTNMTYSQWGSIQGALGPSEPEHKLNSPWFPVCRGHESGPGGKENCRPRVGGRGEMLLQVSPSPLPTGWLFPGKPK